MRLPFNFSSLIFAQPSGVEEATNILASANDYEKKLIDEAIKGLKTNIEAGVTFANK